MRGRSGIRCAPVTDGVLRLGPAVLTLTDTPQPTALPRVTESASQDDRDRTI
jgi:hypothetical protein